MLLKTDPLPLVVFTPKGLLRHPQTASSAQELTTGGWQRVIDDAELPGKKTDVTNLILCSGRIHVDLVTSSLRKENHDNAIVRVEQLYPFPARALMHELGRFTPTGVVPELVWKVRRALDALGERDREVLVTATWFDLSPAEAARVLVALPPVGLLLGLPSRRLLGDYLAIVTLFFAQIFVVLTTNADRIKLPWNDGPTDFTGGPNGITDIDAISILGYEFGSIRSYLWLSLGVFTLVIVALRLLNHSRTGRAWRALREDPLAAELMSIPVNRLKLLAFAFGAAAVSLAFGNLHAYKDEIVPWLRELSEACHQHGAAVPLRVTRVLPGVPAASALSNPAGRAMLRAAGSSGRRQAARFSGWPPRSRTGHFFAI